MPLLYLSRESYLANKDTIWEALRANWDRASDNTVAGSLLETQLLALGAVSNSHLMPNVTAIHAATHPQGYPAFTVAASTRGARITFSGDWMSGEHAESATRHRWVCEIAEHADMILFRVRGHPYRSDVIIGNPTNTLWLPDGIGTVHVNEQGAVIVAQITGEALARRDNIFIYPAENGQVRWVLPSEEAPSNAARVEIGGVVRHASPSFDPDTLLPCATGSGLDRTSFYYHPVKRKIYKLNNTVGCQLGALSTAACGQENIACAAYYSARHGCIRRELVMFGGSVPHNHEDMTDEIRRRLLMRSGQEVTIASARRVTDIGSPGPFTLYNPFYTNRLISGVLSREYGISGAYATFRTGDAEAFDVDHEVFLLGHHIYEILARVDSNRDLTPDRWAGHEDADIEVVVDGTSFAIGARLPSVGCEEWTERVALNRAGTKCYVVESEGPSGDETVVRYNTAEWRRVLAEKWVNSMFDPSADTPRLFEGERRDELISMCMRLGSRNMHAGEDVIVEYHPETSTHTAWLPSWGPSPYYDAAMSERHDIRVKCPRYSPPVACSLCGTLVVKVTVVERFMHPEGSSSPHTGCLCGRCQRSSNGNGRWNQLRMNGYTMCPDCNVWFHVSLIPAANIGACPVCYRRNYQACTSCGNMFHTLELGASGQCRGCRSRGARLHEYNFRPTLHFHRVKDEPICFGAEIELEAAEGSDLDSAEAVGAAAADVMTYPGCRNFMFAKRDGSLQNGAEFVTQPFSWEWFMENTKRFEDIFAKMAEVGFEAKRSCGLHIHVSRSPHSSLEEFRLLQLVYENPVSWKRASGRVVDQYCKFAGPYTGLRARISVARTRHRFQDRYVAVNPTDRDTLEWRIWSGTGQFSKFQSALAMTCGAHQFARSGAVGIRPKIAKFAEYLSNHAVFGPMTTDRCHLLLNP
jgi:hypothetical protein